ncbi:MAG TPA: glycosyltransferase family 39 protein, partial [Methylomirabilota bacterium]|nr:glycosyltransferase family 39 protein [Methylomirabilota bacterium]
MSAALALAVVALALRLWVLRALPVIDADGVSYVTLARRLADGGSAFDPLFHPLYPAAFAVVAPLAGDWELAARLVSALAGALLVLAAWALTRALLGEDAARLAAILVAVHPALVRAGTAAMPEALYALLLVGGVWAAWRALGAGAEAWLVAAGFLFGLAYLARPEGAAYLLGLVAAVLLATLRDRRRRRLAWGGGAVLAWILVAAPYLVYLRGVQGRWTLSGKLAHNLSLVQGTAGAPSPLPWRVLENAYLFQKYALPELLPGVVAFLLVPGVVARARRRGWLAQDGVLLA